MSLGTRLALAFALVAAVVAGTVGVLSYHSASERISGEIDRSLQAATTALAGGQTAVLGAPVAALPDGDGRGGGIDPGRTVGAEGPAVGQGGGRWDDPQQLTAQRVAADGTVTRLGGRDVALPVTGTDRALATQARGGASAGTETRVGDQAYRVLTTAVGGAALQVGIDVDRSGRVLAGTAVEIAVAAVVVTLVAAVLGWLLARRITRRLVRLTALTEEVAAAGLGERTAPVEGRDEVARLSASVNTMLRRLAEARDSQERLVQDAAHELRTPLTSLRTNASVLRRIDRLSPESRERLVADVDGETRELARLVEELVELALARRTDEPETAVDLLVVATAAAERTRRRTGRTITVDGAPSPVRGRVSGLERAVGNLLENAAKFDADPAHVVEVVVRRGTVSVADRGPGVHDGADGYETERIFDRFHRSDAARALPGSGLGLSIVRDVALAHDGTVFAGNRPGGGAAIGFSVGAGRLLPDSDHGHADASPGPASLGGT
ncbi:HAMP domain-containing histidine kinase [Pseudonocardia sp. ICBG1122]|nr:HAMP domain-containing histidine kinase [Pseudonocardia pini]